MILQIRAPLRSKSKGARAQAETMAASPKAAGAVAHALLINYMYLLIYLPYYLCICCVHTHACMLQHTIRSQSRYSDGVSHLTDPLQMFKYVRKLRLTLKTEIFNKQKEDAFQPGLVASGCKYQLLRKHLLCTHPKALCGTALNWELPE